MPLDGPYRRSKTGPTAQPEIASAITEASWGQYAMLDDLFMF